MKQVLVPFVLLLAACGNGAGNATDTPGNIVAAPLAKPVEAAKDVSDEDKSDLLEWSLSYPAAIAAIPPLADIIRAASLKQKAENLAAAKDDKAEREKNDFPFNSYEQSDSWSVVGMTDRLLSFTDEWFVFTGGAHPNHGTKALLWDKAAGRQVELGSILTGGVNVMGALYRNAFCKALDKERAAKRQGEDAVKNPTDPFDQCPKLEELVIIPKGPDKGGPLTVLLFHADPYVAGPYVEGDYDIELPVGADFVAALKPEFRASFATKR